MLIPGFFDLRFLASDFRTGYGGALAPVMDPVTDKAGNGAILASYIGQTGHMRK